MPNTNLTYPGVTLRPKNMVEWLGLITSTIAEIRGEDWFNTTGFTIKELITAINNDKNFATTINNAINLKLNASAYTAADVLAKLKTVDGSGSGLDADLVKGYVPVNKAGDTMTGYLTLHADPTNPTHAATKRYVDELLQGFSIKNAVRVATTGNISLSGTQTIDGIAVIAEDRVLVRAQTDPIQNGIYVVKSGAWVRAVDMDEADDVKSGLAVFVNEGTQYADSGWVLITDGVLTVGVSPVQFDRFSGAGQIVPLDGLYKDGNKVGLTDTGVVAGTWTKVTVDVKGRISAGTTLIASDIPSLDWSKITTGKPTTLAGYGITDAAPLSHTSVLATTAVKGHVQISDGIAVSSGIISVDPGDGITLTGTSPNKKVQANVDGTSIILSGTAGSKVIAHADTSTQASITNTNNTVIQSVTLDTYGHVTALSSKTLTYTDVSAVPASDVVTTATANKILKLDANAKLPASITGNADGNAATASKWQTSRTLSLTGDGTASLTVDGSSNVSGAFTLANTGVVAGIYTKVTVDAKGRITSATAPSKAWDLGLNDVKLIDGRGSYSTTTASATPGQYTKVATITLPAQGTFATTTITFLGGNDSSSTVRKARVSLRARQNTALATAPIIDLNLDERQTVSSTDFVTVTTLNDATKTVIELYVKLPASEQLEFSPILQNVGGTATIEFFSSQPMIGTLPTGAQTTCGDESLTYHEGVTATTSVLGHVKIGNGIAVSSGVISADITDGLMFTGTSPNQKVQARVDGTSIILSGTAGSKVIAHADTSTQTSVSNTANTVIQSVTLDDYGHVTGLTSKTMTYSDVSAVPASGAFTKTGMLTLPDGINFNRSQNYKSATDLPSSFPQGTTTFFVNDSGNTLGYPRQYGTVMVVKAYTNMACTMFFLPYNSNDKIRYRHALFNTDSWLPWEFFETESSAQTKANTAETNAKSYTDTKLAELIDSSPETLNTLNELAAALGDDPNFATTMTNELAKKVNKAGDTMTGDLEIKKAYPKLKLEKTDADKTQLASIEFDSVDKQGVVIAHQFYDDMLPEGGYAITISKKSDNVQTADKAMLVVEGEIYSDNSKVWTAATFNPASKADATHTSVLATTSAIGHVKIGNGIAVAGDGTISADINGDGLMLTGTSPNQKLQARVDGSSIILSGTAGSKVIAHADTSSQASVTNTGTTVIQSIGVDGYGHLTSMASLTITPALIGAETPAGAQAKADAALNAAKAESVSLTGDTMTGQLTTPVIQTDLLLAYRNMWQREYVNVNKGSSAYVPVPQDFVGNWSSMEYITDPVANVSLTLTGGDHFLNRFVTWVYVNADKTVTGTMSSDDRASLYLNGELLYTTVNSATPADISVNLKKGWSQIEAYIYEYSGGEKLTFSFKWADQVTYMTAYPHRTLDLRHATTSQQPSITNSGGSVIQSVQLDTMGHVTGLTTKALASDDIGAYPRTGGDINGNVNIYGSLSLDGKKILELTSNNPEMGTLNPFWYTIRSGKKLYTDEDFASGTNSVNVYNNSGGDGVVITRTDLASSPNKSKKILTFTHNGNAASPNYGGFVQTISSRANGIFAQVFRAKIPTGYWLSLAANSLGTGSTDYWLTPSVGTGKWETYIRITICGNTGSFSTGGFVSLAGSPAPTLATPLVWQMASCSVYDLTDLSDGTGSNINADLLDGLHASSFMRSDANTTTTGDITITNSTPRLLLNKTGDLDTEFSTMEFNNETKQGVQIKHMYYDSQLLESGHGLRIEKTGDNSQPDMKSHLSVEGNIYADGSKVWTAATFNPASKVETSEVVTTATANKILKLNGSAKLPASITGDADTVDGLHASSFVRTDAASTMNNQLTLGGSVADNLVINQSGGYAGILFNSSANPGSDFGYIRFYNDATDFYPSYDVNASTENSLLLIGVENDVSSTSGDILALRGGNKIIFDVNNISASGTPSMIAEFRSMGVVKSTIDVNGKYMGDTDKVDGLHASSFMRSDANTSTSGTLAVSGSTTLNGALYMPFRGTVGQPTNYMELQGVSANDATNENGGAFILFRTSTSAGFGVEVGGVRRAGGAGDFVVRTSINSDSSMSEKMRLTSVGNLGVGTNNPSAKIHSTGTIKADDTITSGANVEAAETVKAKKIAISDKVELQYNATENSLDIVFI